MVIPNFFITFVRHSFHTSHSLHIPSRERRHRPAPFLPPGATPPLTAHALPHALRTRDCLTHCTSQRAMPHAPRTRYASLPSQHPRPPRYHPRKGLRHTRHAHATHPRPHSTHALRATTPSQRATPCRATTKHESHTPPRTHAPQVFCEESASPITTKILHITILHVTFTRIGVKTTQKSEAIFSFID